MGDTIKPLRAFRFTVEMRGDIIPTTEAAVTWTHERGYELRLARGMMADDPANTPFTRVFRDPTPHGEELAVNCLDHDGTILRRIRFAAMRAIEYNLNFDNNKDEVLMEHLLLRGGVVADEVIGKVETP